MSEEITTRPAYCDAPFPKGATVKFAGVPNFDVLGTIMDRQGAVPGEEKVDWPFIPGWGQLLDRTNLRIVRLPDGVVAWTKMMEGDLELHWNRCVVKDAGSAWGNTKIVLDELGDSLEPYTIQIEDLIFVEPKPLELAPAVEPAAVAFISVYTADDQAPEHKPHTSVEEAWGYLLADHPYGPKVEREGNQGGGWFKKEVIVVYADGSIAKADPPAPKEYDHFIVTTDQPMTVEYFRKWHNSNDIADIQPA